MNTLIINFAIFFSFYILGAYATTDILRLLKGSTRSVTASECYCPICRSKIALKDQLPIFAYIKNRGQCQSCGSKIPLSDLFLEIFLFLLLSCIGILSRFSWTGFVLCVFAYEFTKLIFLLRFGKRETDFPKNLLLSLLNNMILFGIVAFLFLLRALV